MKVDPKALDLICHPLGHQESGISIRDYLKEILEVVWVEGEVSYDDIWRDGIYQALVANKLVKGTLDEDGYLEDVNYEQADKYVKTLIRLI